MKIKKILSFFIISVLIIIFSVMPLSAESLNVALEIRNIISYYAENSQNIQNFDEVIVFSSINSIQGNMNENAYFEREENETLAYAKLILARLSVSNDPYKEYNGKNPVDELKSRQTENGAFGDFYVQINSIAALEAVRKAKSGDSVLYDSRKAVEHLLSFQSGEGDFGDLIKTCSALTILSEFSADENVNNSINRARDYIKSKQLDNGGFEDNGTENIVSLSYVIQGLTDIGEDVNTQDWRFMPSRILSFKNEDGSYRFSEDGEQTFSEEATICALKACDTLSNSKSPYKKLMVSGTIQASAIDNMIPVFIVYGLLAAMSLIFWGYIMWGRKNKKISEETQEFVERMNRDED